MQAVLLAGGKGTRLKPYTTLLPKPLVPVGEHSIMSIVISQLRNAGVRKVTLAIGHLADLIMAFYGTGERFGVDIEYSVEQTPLGTVGPIRLIKDLPEHFIVMNGDILADLDYGALFRDHVASGCQLSIAAYQRSVAIDFGVLKIDPSTNRLTGFREKPVYDFSVSAGVYIFSRSLLRRVPPGKVFGFDSLVLSMLADHEPVNIYPHRGYWLDLGRPDDYDQANRDIVSVDRLRAIIKESKVNGMADPANAASDRH